MCVVHTNRKGQTYFLHETRDESGKPRYHFSSNSSDGLAPSIPEGYEVYEHPNGQVFCRRKQEEIINIEEVALIASGIQLYSGLDSVIVDVRKNKIIVYLPNSTIDDLAASFFRTSTGREKQQRRRLSRYQNFDPVLRFVLTDRESRRFDVQRFCYLGSIYDWIDLSASSENLAELAREFLPHLGKDSFYDLY